MTNTVIVRNMKDPESIKFWEKLEKAVAEYSVVCRFEYTQKHKGDCAVTDNKSELLFEIPSSVTDQKDYKIFGYRLVFCRSASCYILEVKKLDNMGASSWRAMYELGYDNVNAHTHYENAFEAIGDAIRSKSFEINTNYRK